MSASRTHHPGVRVGAAHCQDAPGVGLDLSIPSWWAGALCAQVDPEIFHPEIGDNVAPAKKICQGCDVRAECLADALERRDQFGVWGGTVWHERKKMLAEAAKCCREPECEKAPWKEGAYLCAGHREERRKETERRHDQKRRRHHAAVA